MLRLYGRHRLILSWVAFLALLCAGPAADLQAKGFSGRGGGRMGGGSFSRSTGKSFAFSGSSSGRTSYYRPSYDRSAAVARRHETSALRYNSWKTDRGISETPSFDPSLAQTRVQRSEREFSWRQPTGYYSERPNVVVYHDSYDNGFMKYVTLMWLFNHWGSVDRSRFDDERIHDLETKFRDLEAKGYQRDPNYAEPGIDPDLAYKHDEAYKPRSSPLAKIFWGIVVAGLLSWLTWFIFVRRVPYARA